MKTKNKKYLVDISIVVDSSEINYFHNHHIVLTKTLKNGQKIIIELPTVDEYTGENLKEGHSSELFCADGWWIREKDKTQIKNGLDLLLAE